MLCAFTSILTNGRLHVQFRTISQTLHKRVQAIQVANKLSILCFASSTAFSFREAKVRRLEAENRGK